MKQNSFLTLLFVCIPLLSLSQIDSTSLIQKRLKPLLIGSSVVYTGALIGLNELWYSDFERQSFKFFDDSQEWKQVDKAGHFLAAFHISSSSYKGLKWAGVKEHKSIFWGSLTSAIILLPIEVFDGFSAEYGASYSDIIANTAGASMFYFQQKGWGEIKITPKFSFRRTDFPAQRPELLGQGLSEEILKDYNGQTYWLSFDLNKLISPKIPKWLNIGFGYGATDMISARDEQNKQLGLNPRRQYYLAIDFDLSQYHSSSKFLNTLIHFINMIHLPAPTLEVDNELKFHFIY